MQKKNSLINRFEVSCGKWVVKHRWWIIATTILTVFGVFNGMQYLTFNADNRVFFSEDNP
jgi:predicted RND superfamily exporter protein